MWRTARRKSSSDASRCQGVGPQSYGTTPEVVLYDSNHKVVPILFSHSISMEWEETWGAYSSVWKNTWFRRRRESHYSRPGENHCQIISCCYIKSRCLPPPPACNIKMAPHLGAERASSLALCGRALRAPSQETVELLKSQKCEKKRNWLSRIADKELYRAYSRLQDLINTFHGEQIQMRSSLGNHIWCVKPQQMLKAVISTQLAAFLKSKTVVLANINPAPPHIGKHITQKLLKARTYQQSFGFIEGNNLMEVTVVIQRDAMQLRHVRRTLNLRFYLFAAHSPPMVMDSHDNIPPPSFMRSMVLSICTSLFPLFT